MQLMAKEVFKFPNCSLNGVAAMIRRSVAMDSIKFNAVHTMLPAVRETLKGWRWPGDEAGIVDRRVFVLRKL